MTLKIGLTLPNRGVLFNATTPRQLLELAEIADKTGGFNSIWVGDSLLAKPRLEAITLLGALAARTEKVRLGAACLASFPLRDPIQLANQWASLDQIAEGRTVLVACNGNVDQEAFKVEAGAYNVSRKDRVERVTEGIQVIKQLWTEDNASHHGKHYNYDNVTILPKPYTKPRPPVWLAVHAPASDPELVERTHKRIVNNVDGWQTSKWQFDDLEWRVKDLQQKAADAGKPKLATHLYHNINLNDDIEAGYQESKKFLDLYYTTDYSEEWVKGWTALGSPEQVVEKLKRYEAIGFDEVTMRITSWNQQEQLALVINEILPHFA